MMFVCFKGGKFLSHKQVFFDALSPSGKGVKFSLFLSP
ncbi:hypothetical protein HPHPA8_1256 [Helicobacter pylori Hp A-8]|nr:hypothetical protein HPHPA8_1256 [Helicobacter pylori Hp A-8]